MYHVSFKRPVPGGFTGPGRLPCASSYTQKRLSLSQAFSTWVGKGQPAPPYFVAETVVLLFNVEATLLPLGRDVDGAAEEGEDELAVGRRLEVPVQQGLELVHFSSSTLALSVGYAGWRQSDQWPKRLRLS